MKKYLSILLTSIMIINMVSIFYLANALGEESELIFRVKVSGLGLRASSSFTKNKNPDDIVEVSLPGKLYDPYIEVVEINKKSIDRSTPESAELSFYSANRKGDAEWIIDSWAEADQNEIQNFIEEFLSQNTELLQNIDKSYITGKAAYKNYIMLFIQNKYSDDRESHIIHTYIKTTNGWKVTNALSADETHDVVFVALRIGEVMLKEK